jgi:hypothetical protein
MAPTPGKVALPLFPAHRKQERFAPQEEKQATCALGSLYESNRRAGREVRNPNLAPVKTRKNKKVLQFI